uniref:Uncharacterized protein n=1 Tax=Fagus sylvatica TaxID=28930 RepID=A0A2N9G9N6_FAGSY
MRGIMVFRGCMNSSLLPGIRTPIIFCPSTASLPGVCKLETSFREEEKRTAVAGRVPHRFLLLGCFSTFEGIVALSSQTGVWVIIGAGSLPLLVGAVGSS